MICTPGSTTRRRAAHVLLVAGVVACGTTAPLPSTTPAPAPSPLASRRSAVDACSRGDETRWAGCVLATLTVRQKAAQMVWPTSLGDYTAADAPSWRRFTQYVTDDEIGGLTMSVGSPTEIAAKLNALQRLSVVPLLVGADLEFGAGYRARGGYILPGMIDLGGAVVFPPEMAIGATRDSALAYEQGRVTAIEGRALGIHIVYGPILDVNNNPANPVINTRSFGEDPALDAKLGAALIRGIQENGMIATGKHFPGHGDTGVNSHLALPVVNASRARLDSVEFVPFRAAIGAGVGAMMTFHGSMPALDSTGVPGTLSRPVLQGVLRDALGFRGVVISDAMDMRGVLDQFGAVEATKRAVAAGADVLIQPLDVRATIDAVVAGVSEGRYPESRLDDAVRRILEMKRRVGLHRHATVDIEAVRTIVGDSAHAATASAAAIRSITLVRDSLHAVPMTGLKAGARVLSVTVAPRTDLAAGVAFNSELRRTVPGLVTVVVAPEDSLGIAALMRAADSSDAVIVSSYIAHNWQATTVAAPRAIGDLVRALVKRGKPPVVISFGNPYLLQQVPDAPAYMVAWGGFPVSQRAAAWALQGETPIGGLLPISIPPLASFGAGIARPASSSRAQR
ncbi:MAG TPA: glycoside hydrolase family 3 N-terminal domain-containing protein [Gemmatimonadaceae bacterium]|nr:glycoside hydrolase family 3 N-terminal domain-containing protein [Gemmatimonadaceae bacterium]